MGKENFSKNVNGLKIIVSGRAVLIVRTVWQNCREGVEDYSLLAGNFDCCGKNVEKEKGIGRQS